MGSAYEDAVLRVATMDDCFMLAKLEPPSNPRKLTRCPLPDHAERTGSFHILPSLQGFKCFGCDAHGGMIAFLIAMKVAKMPQEALLKLGDLHKISRDDDTKMTYTQRRKRAASPPFVPLPPEPTPSSTPEDLVKIRNALKGAQPLLSVEGKPGAIYIGSRGLDPAKARESRVRYHPQGGRREGWDGLPSVVFEVVGPRGDLVALQFRFLDPAADPKAKSCGPIRLGVFATVAALEAPVVGIVEGPMDALALAQSGLPALALMGKESKPWLRRYLRGKHVVIATDADAAGSKAAEKLCAELTLSSVARLTFPPSIKDANEFLQRDPDALRQRVQALLLGDAADAERNAADDDLLVYALAQCQVIADRHPAEARRMEARFNASARATAAHAA